MAKKNTSTGIDLKQVAKEFFDYNKNASEGYITADGTCFFTENAARNHAGKNGKIVKAVRGIDVVAPNPESTSDAGEETVS